MASCLHLQPTIFLKDSNCRIKSVKLLLVQAALASALHVQTNIESCAWRTIHFSLRYYCETHLHSLQTLEDALLGLFWAGDLQMGQHMKTMLPLHATTGWPEYDCSTVRTTCSTALAFAGDRIAWATIALLRHRTFGLNARSELNCAGLATKL